MGAPVMSRQTTSRYAALRLLRGTAIFIDRLLSAPCGPPLTHVGRALSALGIVLDLFALSVSLPLRACRCLDMTLGGLIFLYPRSLAHVRRPYRHLGDVLHTLASLRSFNDPFESLPADIWLTHVHSQEMASEPAPPPVSRATKPTGYVPPGQPAYAACAPYAASLLSVGVLLCCVVKLCVVCCVLSVVCCHTNRPA